ncbi:MAG: hypothetical protein R6W06_11760 [Prochlorococcaceae cyanobacterium]
MARDTNRKLQQPGRKRFSPSLPFGIDSRPMLVSKRIGCGGA